MAFDLSNVMAAAESAVQGTSSNGNYPPIIYPGNGIITVRLLFNPKSNQVMRLIHRHKLDSGKVDCASHWGMDCPVCKTLDTIKTVKGLDLWTLKSKTYGIAYAQFVSISDGYDFGSRKVPAPGDLIVLMFPWSVYKQISELIQKSGEHASDLLTSNIGKVFTIKRSVGADGRTEYRVDIDPFITQYESAPSQMEFDKFLEDLPDLNETLSPKDLPEGHLTKLQLEADNLAAKYLGNGQVYTPTAPQTPVASPIVPTSASVTPEVAQSIPFDNAVPSASAGSPAPASPSITNIAPAQPAITQSDSVASSPQEAVVSVQQPTPVVEQQSTSEFPSCMGNLNLKDRKCLVCAHTIKCRAQQQSNQ